MRLLGLVLLLGMVALLSACGGQEGRLSSTGEQPADEEAQVDQDTGDGGAIDQLKTTPDPEPVQQVDPPQVDPRTVDPPETTPPTPAPVVDPVPEVFPPVAPPETSPPPTVPVEKPEAGEVTARAKTIAITVKNTEEYEYRTGMGGDEQGASIKTQASHFEKSDMIRGPSTNFEPVYKYTPKKGYVGKDSVELELSDHQLGSGPDNPGKTTRSRVVINFTVEAEPATQSEDAIDVDLLARAWTHSYEEDKDFEGRVFRPTESQKFPPSRFRRRYVFNEDGSGNFLYLHPADAHRMVACQWKVTEDDPRRIRITAMIGGKKREESIEVLALTKDILRVK